MRNDILSSILQRVRMDGGVYFRCEFNSPWGMKVDNTGVADFHVVVRGSCWLHLANGKAPIPLQGGDLLVFPHGDPHTLTDAADNCHALPAADIVGDQNLDHYGPILHGGDGAPAQLLCGYFRFDPAYPNPLVQSLPALIHIKGTSAADISWLQTTLNLMYHETRQSKPGANALLNGLVRVLFVQMVRAHLEQSPSHAGLLAAISDRQIGTSLQIMHDSPGLPWTLETLARRVGMSRSAFTNRFHQLTNTTPLRYLTQLRMQHACDLLKDTLLGMSEVAEQSGYQSEAAFGKAFKKAMGIGPGAWRKAARYEHLNPDRDAPPSYKL